MADCWRSEQVLPYSPLLVERTGGWLVPRSCRFTIRSTPTRRAPA